jgi:hypothetical protein
MIARMAPMSVGRPWIEKGPGAAGTSQNARDADRSDSPRSDPLPVRFTGDEKMKALLKFRPELHASELEERLVPAGPNPGVIVLTTSGYVLLTPSAGAAYPGGPSGGTAIPTSFVITGFGGISSMQPGSIAGLPATAPSVSNGGAGATITVGSGANDASAPNIPLVTRNTIANDALNPRAQIGRDSGDRSPVLPPGQVYRGGFAETAPAPVSEETPGREAIRIPRRGPLDVPSIGPGGTLPRLSSDASGDFIKTIADRTP